MLFWGRASWWWAFSSAGRIAATSALTGRFSALSRRWSKWHVKIPPDECIQCRLCEEACPYGAIREPTARAAGRRAAARPAAVGRAAGLLPGAGGRWVLAGPATGNAAGQACIRPSGLAERVCLEQTGRVAGHDRHQRRLPQHGPPGRGPLPRGVGHAAAASAGPAAGSAPGSGWCVGVKLIHLSRPPSPQRLSARSGRAASPAAAASGIVPGEQARQGWIQTIEPVTKG